MHVKFVDLYAQYESIRNELDPVIAEVIRRTAFIGGPFEHQFTVNFAAFLGHDRHVVGMGNGTDAITLVCRALNIGPGDEVIVPAGTFIATSEAVSAAGAKPVFADIHPVSYNLDPEKIESLISPKTKAIMPVHLYGHPADLDAIGAIARKHGLMLIEDSAQAHGALYRKQRVGTFGDAAIFSFYPGKNLGAYGDGGAAAFRDPDAAHRCKALADHGRLSKYDHSEEGFNSRLDGLQAAILDVKLRHLDDWNAARRRIAAKYDQLLAGIPGLRTPTISAETTPIYHLYVIRTSRREELRDFLAAHEIDTGVHYPIALPFLKAYEHYGCTTADFPVAAVHQNEVLSLPIYAEMPNDHVEFVAEKVREFFRG
jgi:dTDP-4-amino-4,6-dideoxygalactose transaminase